MRKLASFQDRFIDGAMLQGLSIMKASRPARPAARREPLNSARMLKLIGAAEDIFLAKGYHAATMNDVAKAAGMSKKTVYQIIESKAELFTVLLAHYQSLLKFPTTQPSWSINDILVENLLCLGRFLLSSEQIAIIRLIMAEYTHSPDFGRSFHQKRVMKARFRLESCLLDIAGKDCMTLRDAREKSAILFGMALGEFHLGVLLGFHTAPSRPALERRIRRAVALFLAGCFGTDTDRLSKPASARSGFAVSPGPD